jgi:hypothetical protein
MSSTPRKSSIASRTRRPPPSLRIASATRKASNPHLTLIFAQGDSSLPFGSFTSEQTLSRQLDGDLGGRQIGLRSRRSSSATVQTMRTFSGIRDGSPSPSVREEDEEDIAAGEDRAASQAGPSTPVDRGATLLPLHQESSVSVPAASPEPAPRLNPKSSSSWLRWNSPAPSFPRHADKGKGKATEDRMNDHALVSPPAESAPASLSPANQREPAPGYLTTTASTQEPDVSPGHVEVDPPDPPLAPSRSIPPKQSWWRRNAPSVPPPTRQQLSASDAPSCESTVTAGPSKSTLPITGVEARSLPARSDSLPRIPQSGPGADGDTQIVERQGDADKNLSTSNHPEQGATANGWISYLGWRGLTVAPASSSGQEAETKETSKSKGVPPVAESTHQPSSGGATGGSGDAVQPHPSSPDHAGPSAPSDHKASAPAVTASAVSTASWGTYLSSFVANPKHITRSTPFSDKHAVLPSDPAGDQKPISTSPPNLHLEGPPPGTGTIPDLEHSQPEGQLTGYSSRTASPIRKGSTASTSGWLHYLALRAQRRLPAPGSGSIGTGETEGRKSSETQGEEIMDFSSDPEFPSAPTLPATIPNPKEQPKPEKTIANKASQLSVRQKRLSISSAKSGGSMTPLSSSPKHSVLEGKTPNYAKAPSTSALPPPPQPPASQPSLVIPTFPTTFDRPPRSFLPLPVSEVMPSPNVGITARTTGLAWRAITTAGSFVYGGGPAPGPESIAEDNKETRGRREGRRVGADLPRRIGLGHGGVNDGWKNVRRVVVVGVHGWYVTG